MNWEPWTGCYKISDGCTNWNLIGGEIWSCFHGDKTAFFAVMGNLYQHTHTYANIQRENCFCSNFLPISCCDQLIDTINHNDLVTGEPN